jgi:hypothetical protein
MPSLRHGTSTRGSVLRPSWHSQALGCINHFMKVMGGIFKGKRKKIKPMRSMP